MKNAIQKLSIVGMGNVGSHLFEAFAQEEIEITHIVSRSKPSREILGKSNWIQNPHKLPDGQLVLICVPDDLIASFIVKIPANCPIAYTSGSVELGSLPEREELGVFYPLQTFTKGSPLNLFEVPFFIEARSTDFASKLFDLAWVISRKVQYANSADRKKLHLAAVFVNNFTNHLAYISQSYLEKEGLDFEHLKPLLKETAHKLESQNPEAIQTGPARRKDKEIIHEHLSALENPIHREIYRLFSESIHQTYFHD